MRRKRRDSWGLTNQILERQHLPSRQNLLTFANIQLEKCGDTGRVHLQGYFQAKTPCKNDQWESCMQALCGPGYGHLICGSSIRGSSEENIMYTSKPHAGNKRLLDGVSTWDPTYTEWTPGCRIVGTLPCVWGTPRSIEGKKQGERSDISQVYQWIKSNLDTPNLWGAALEEFEGTAAFTILSLRKNCFNDMVQTLRQQKLQSELEEDISALSLLPWQQQMADILSATPDPRLIHVVVDVVGGAGKSTLLNYLCVKCRWISLTCGKRDDLLHALRNQLMSGNMMGIAVDCPMSSVNDGTDSRTGAFQFVENCKNRRATALKYDSAVIMIPKCHVLIMTNTPIPPESFGDKRLHIHTLSKVANTYVISSRIV